MTHRAWQTCIHWTAESGDHAVSAERYYYNGMEQYLNIPLEEIEKNDPPVQLAGDAANVLEEYLASTDFSKLDAEPRLVIHLGK